MKKLWGDRAKELTKAIGIKKPCAGCEKRAETLNQLSRMGFMKSLAIGAFILKDKSMLFGWKALGFTPPVGLPEAVGLMRQIGTRQHEFYDLHDTFATETEILSAVESHRGHYKPGTVGYAWMQRFSATASEVMPGWKFSCAVVPGKREFSRDGESWEYNNGFRIVLAGPDYTLALDENFLIYMSVDSGPSAANLAKASDYPGAAPIDQFKEKLSVKKRILNFITPTVYASCDCTGNFCACGIYGCAGVGGQGGCYSCTTCVTRCCKTGCWNTRPSRCYVFVGCTGCTWNQNGCYSPDCACCGNFLGGACCATLCTCPPCV